VSVRKSENGFAFLNDSRTGRLGDDGFVTFRRPLNSGGASGSTVVLFAHFALIVLMTVDFHGTIVVEPNLDRICFEIKDMVQGTILSTVGCIAIILFRC
jgi:hypothetical protein